MDAARISLLLQPYADSLTSPQVSQISGYLDLLLRWNARMNLTAVRDPEQIVTRHFGESLFLGHVLQELGLHHARVTDVGSGAGFPGIPLKIALPEITLTLIEAQQRKSVFLREVLRTIHLEAEVRNVRAEQLLQSEPASAEVVTLRAVEKFELILPKAAQFAWKGGKLAILIGKAQVVVAQSLLRNWQFAPPRPIPGSESRVILLGNQVG